MSIISESSFEHPEFGEPNIEAGYSIFEHNKRLLPNKATRIDCSKGDILGEGSEFRRELVDLIGEPLPVIAQVGLKNRQDSFFVLDSTESRKYKSPYVIIKEETGENGHSKIVSKGVWPNKTTVIGRSSLHKNRFSHSPHVSNSHFSLAFDGEDIIATDLDSINGTFVTGYMRLDENIFRPGHYDNIKDSYTENFVKRAKRLGGFDDDNDGLEAPYGTFKNFAIIGRNSRSVRNGIYGTSNTQSEFVLVNANSPQVTAIEKNVIDRVKVWYGSRLKGKDILNALKYVRDTTAEKMRYDLSKVKDLSRPYFDTQDFIKLSDYIDEGVGVCRHQALLAAVLAEGLIREGILDGSVHVERNHDLEVNGAHAWMVFEGEGEAIIVDPAQNFVGTREKARQEGRWRYYVDASRQR